MPITRSAARRISGATWVLRWASMSSPRLAITSTASAVAGLPEGYDPAEDTRPETPASARRRRRRASAIGERHWLAVQSRSTSMQRL